MAVRFIIGRSGTGKTHYCVNAIVDALLQSDSRPLIYLVPEQATYQAQRSILSDRRITGYNRLHVLSFDRLVYLALGKNSARPFISRLGRNMVIQRILRDCSTRLKVFSGSARLPGLGLRLAETITRLQQYANTPEDLENLVQKLQKTKTDNLTAAKFADIAVVFGEYQKFIEGRFLDPDMQLVSACRALHKAPFLKGARLWVDGFAGFTSAELALLTGLLKTVNDARIALCLDSAAIDLANPDKARIDPADLFSPTGQTYADLVEGIKKCRLKLENPLILDKPQRFSASPPLAHLERTVFTPALPKMAAEDKIRIVSAPNARAEVRFVASQIAKLVRDAGCRYRDIAVIASDIDRYAHYIKASFEDYKIPVFIDRRRPLNQHPVIELLCSALAAVTNDFSPADVFAYLKSDLLDIERGEVDILENYCIAFGITASDWTAAAPWQYAAEKAERFHEQQVDHIRRKAIAPLVRLKKHLADAADTNGLMTAGQFKGVVFDFLETIDIHKRISAWVKNALNRADYATADEHCQLYKYLFDVFDELTEAFIDCPLGCEDFFAIIRSAFSQITLAFIPPNLDQVLVGSIERSRHPDLKAVFLIGATERQFPTPVVFDSILTEDDRLVAQSSGLDLPPGIRQELANRAYLAYIAFTRPSEFLCITWPAVDNKASAVVRSPFVDNLCELFEDLKPETPAPEPSEIEEVSSEYELEDLLCCRLGKQSPSDDPRLAAILSDMQNDDQLAELGSRVNRAIGYENNACLDDSVVNALFGGQLTSSASRLSTFAACPYKHFARHVLELKKRDEFKLEPLDVGEFYHQALDRFLKRAVKEKIDFEKVTPSELTKVLDEEIDNLCRDDSFISKFTAHSPHNAFLLSSARQYLHDCVVAVSRMISAGCFRPVLSEISFGQPKSGGETIGEFKIAISAGRQLSLNGRIDRLDIAQISGRKVALVFDYKKGSKSSFSWSEFFYGLDIQLAVYMLTVRNAVRSIADDIAGAFYIPIEAAPKQTSLAEIDTAGTKFAHKAGGIFNGEYASLLDPTASKDSRFYNFYIKKDGDPYGKYNMLGALYPADFDAFLKFCSRKIADLAEQIASGKIAVAPYRLGTISPCSWCDYKPVCRFDWRINDYNLLSRVDKQQVLEQIKNIDGSKKD